MSPAAFVVLIFSAFNLIGGLIGWVKAKSKASVITGTASAIVLFASASGMGQGVRAAYWIAIVVAAILDSRFALTWVKTRRVMPDLIMIILSNLTLILVVWELFSRT